MGLQIATSEELTYAGVVFLELFSPFALNSLSNSRFSIQPTFKEIANWEIVSDQF